MSEEKKVVIEERRFAIITKDSIKMMAECSGHADISDTVAGIMGEDVSYRLREITQKSAQFMRHAKRRRLNTEDFNKACRFSDIQPVHGHGSVDKSATFRQTRDGEIFFVDDPDVNLAKLATNDFLPKQLGDTTIKAHWLSVEGIQKNSQNPQAVSKPEASPVLKRYFDKISQAIMGYDTEMMKTALTDLRTNKNISPLLPSLVSFVHNGVKAVNHDVRQLMQLMYLVRSLVCNDTLFLEVQPYLPLLMQSLQFCLLEPLSLSTRSSTDQWTLRDTAARLQAHIVSIWDNPVNRLERFTEKTLREVLYDSSKPFSSHYGAVMGLLELGAENIERVLLPHLATYLPPLTSVMEVTSPESHTSQTDAHKVYGAILLSVEFVLKKHIEEFKEECLPQPKGSYTDNGTFDPCTTGHEKYRHSSGFISLFNKSPSAFYREMSQHFGDSLYLRLPEIPELKQTVYKRAPKEVTSSLMDPESNKSGEQLLEELMEQVRKQEQSSRKQKQREKYMLQKHEKDFEEKLSRQRTEQERRKEDHRQQLLLRKQRMSLQESDDEIDVEGDVDRSDNSFQSEEGDTGDVAVAVRSSIGAPGQGIKMTFTKRHKLQASVVNLTDSPQSDNQEGREGRQDRKRKHSRSPELFDFGSLEDFGSFSPGSFSPEMDASDILTGPTVKFRRLDNE